MRYILLLSTLFFGFFYTKEESNKDMVVHFFYDGSYPHQVEKGLAQWRKVKNINFQKTDSENLSVLKIYDVETEDMQNANALGEFKKAYNLIRLNRSRELDERQWEAVVAHEVGHFLLLDHSKDPLSVMSNNIHVNDDDVANAKNMKKLLYYKQLLFKFADKISFR